jgi:hypothetical protein
MRISVWVNESAPTAAATEHGACWVHAAVSSPLGDAYNTSLAAAHVPAFGSQTSLAHSLSPVHVRHARPVASHTGNGLAHSLDTVHCTHTPFGPQWGAVAYVLQSTSATQPSHTSVSIVQRGCSIVHALGPSHAPHVPITQYGCSGLSHCTADEHGLSAPGLLFAHAVSAAKTPSATSARTPGA